MEEKVPKHPKTIWNWKLFWKFIEMLTTQTIQFEFHVLRDVPEPEIFWPEVSKPAISTNQNQPFSCLIRQNGHARWSMSFLLIFCHEGCAALWSIWRDTGRDAACYFGCHRQLPIINQHVNRFQHTLQIISAQVGESSKECQMLWFGEKTGGQNR